MNEYSALAWLAQAAGAIGAESNPALSASGTSVWLPYLYQYLVGGGLFLLAIVVAIRKGALDLQSLADRRLLRMLLLGLTLYALLHGSWVYWASTQAPSTADELPDEVGLSQSPF